jgi:hypothetical protein
VYATAYNTTDRPIVVDAEGRSIGGGEFGTVDTTADEAKMAAEAGDLFIYPELTEGPGQNPAATDAIRNTETVRARAIRLGELEKEDLQELGGQAGMADANDARKRDLVTGLAFRTDFDDEAALAKMRGQVSDDELAAMSIDQARDYLTKHPDELDRIDALEDKRDGGRRAGIDELIDRARDTQTQEA